MRNPAIPCHPDPVPQEATTLQTTNTAPAARRSALMVLSGGGFTFETTCLLGSLQQDFEFTYLVTESGGLPGQDGIPEGPFRLVPKFASVTRPSHLVSARAFLVTFGITVSVLLRRRLGTVIVVGCSHAVPMLIAARLLGRRTVYIESVTRVDRLSNTGKLVYHLRLARIFLVQWIGLQKAYPASRLGTIL